jgi:hypothetical protein
MKLKKNIATSEAGFVFNPATGDSFSVNPVGADILLQLKENSEMEDIISGISVKYDVDRGQLEKDLEDFVSQLHGYNLLERHQ